MNQQLLDYIKQARASGMADDQIKQTLLKTGWNEGDVVSALSSTSPAALYPQSTAQSVQGMATSPSVPKLVKILSLFGYLAAALAGLFGVVGIIGATLFGTALRNAASSNPLLSSLVNVGTWVFMGIGIILIGSGLLNFFVSRGLWKGKNWARIYVVAISLLAVAGFVLGIISSGQIKNTGSILSALAVALYLLLSKKVKAAFTAPKSLMGFQRSISIALSLTAVLAVSMIGGGYFLFSGPATPAASIVATSTPNVAPAAATTTPSLLQPTPTSSAPVKTSPPPKPPAAAPAPTAAPLQIVSMTLTPSQMTYPFSNEALSVTLKNNTSKEIQSYGYRFFIDEKNGIQIGGSSTGIHVLPGTSFSMSSFDTKIFSPFADMCKMFHLAAGQYHLHLKVSSNATQTLWETTTGSTIDDKVVPFTLTSACQ